MVNDNGKCAQVKRLKVRQVEAMHVVQQELACPICLEWLDAAVETDCGHVFCANCLLQTLNRSQTNRCPACRAKVQQAVPARSLRRVVESVKTAVGLGAGSKLTEVSLEGRLNSRIHHLNLSSHQGAPLFPDWHYCQRTLCCSCVGLRPFVACACVFTVGINLALVQLSAPEKSQQSQTNIFSIFTYCCGLLAALTCNGNVASVFVAYSAADTVFALLGPVFWW
jgi:hypothetical protein